MIMSGDSLEEYLEAIYSYNEKGHPFVDGTGTLALMHNGTIYNYRELWEDLRDRHEFTSYSEDVDDITDSEVAVHILREALDAGESMEEALRFLATAVKGEFLFGVISAEHPETVWIANWAQPCVVALNDDEAMFVSSPIGFYDVREEFVRVFTPPWNSIIKLTRGRVEISTMDPSRRVPRLNQDDNVLARSILAALERNGKMEVRNLRASSMDSPASRASLRMCTATSLSVMSSTSSEYDANSCRSLRSSQSSL